MSSLIRLDQSIGQKQRLLRSMELLAAGVMLAVSCSFLWRVLRPMATTSLWNDELYTILNFSSRGPWTVVTDYHVANNHVFFNLVNSLTPGSSSVMPLRARFWSFAAVLTSLGLLLAHFFRRRRFIEGALAFSLIVGHDGILDLTLQARGYGFLCLASVVLTLSVVRFVETRDTRALYWLALASVLGTWTVPTFLLFSGSTLLVLWAWFRSKEIFCCGAIVALAVAAVYAPIASQVWHDATTYALRWGEAYAEFNAVGETISYYLLPSNRPWLVMVLIVVALVAPYHLPASPAVLASRILTLAVFASLALFLFQKTPGVRTTFFIVVPLAYALITIGSELLRGRWAAWSVTMFAVAALTVSTVWSNRVEYRFTPVECWLEVAKYVRKHFPPGTVVVASFRNHFLRAYLDPAYPIVDGLDQAAFLEGRQVVVDSNFQASERFNPLTKSDKGVAVRIPQRRGGFQVIAYVPR